MRASLIPILLDYSGADHYDVKKKLLVYLEYFTDICLAVRCVKVGCDQFMLCFGGRFAIFHDPPNV